MTTFLDQINEDLGAIATDITDIKAKLDAAIAAGSGGISATDAQDLVTRIDAARQAMDTLAGKTATPPDATVPPGETPVTP